MNKFIDDAAMISEKKGKCPFVITNTDSSENVGTHWWSILNIEPEQDIFFFDSSGLDGLKTSSYRTIKMSSKKYYLGWKN